MHDGVHAFERLGVDRPRRRVPADFAAPAVGRRTSASTRCPCSERYRRIAVPIQPGSAPEIVIRSLRELECSIALSLP